jgi:linolenate 9R-lipoxygenase
MSNQDSVLSGDPRTQDIEDQFRVLISGIARAFGTIAHVKGLRATHSYGTIARGVLTVLDSPSIPNHTVFSSGKRYPVLVRHANIKGFPDDAIIRWTRRDCQNSVWLS